MTGSRQFNFSVVDDDIIEGDEEVVFTLMVAASSEGATAISSMRLTIEDNDGLNPYDADGNGLIEIWNLQQLSAIRCDLNGDGEVDVYDENNTLYTNEDRTDYNTSSNPYFYVSRFGYDDCPPDDVSYRGYELMVDLDFAGSIWSRNAGWAPIGDGLDDFNGTFTGEFDGRGNTISNLYISRADNNIGLFGAVGDGAIVCNVRLAGVQVIGSGLYAGGLSGYNAGRIASSCVEGHVEATVYAGGLVGGNDGVILGSYAMGDVGGGGGVGGLVGINGVTGGGSVVSSYSTATVASPNFSVGGLVGQHSTAGSIISSYATGDVSGSTDVGGLVGDPSGTITESFYSTAATVTLGGAPVPPDVAYARSAKVLSSFSNSAPPPLAWTQTVDVDGISTTTHDQYMPWDFRTNYEYPVLRPYPGRAALVEFDAQFHAPVAAFDNEVDAVDEPASDSVLHEIGVTMYNTPDDGNLYGVRVRGLGSSTAINGSDCHFSFHALPVAFAGSHVPDFPITVTVLADDEAEEDETMVFELIKPSAGVLLDGPSLTTITIRRNDQGPPPIPAVSFTDTLTVFNEDIGTLTVVVSIDFAATESITIPIVVDASSTANSADYTLPDPSSVTFAPGETSQNYVVTIVDDLEFEESEFLTLIFGTLPPSVTESATGFGTHRLTVGDNDPAPPPPDYTVSFSESAVTVGEDVGTVEVEVFLSNGPLPLTNDITIPITVVGGTLSALDDYTLVTSVVTFPASLVPTTPGQLTSSFTVTIEDDDLVEETESAEFTFDTSGLPDVGEGTQSTYTLTVTDTDNYEVSFAPGPDDIVAENNAFGDAARRVTVFVYLSPLPYAGTDPLEIPIVVNSGGTLSVDDYTYNQTVTFAPGASSAENLTIDIVDDDLVEGDESAVFTFGELPPRVVLSTSEKITHTLTVTDIDEYEVSFLESETAIDEDGVGRVIVFVSISPLPYAGVDILEIPIVVSSSSTLSADDYTYDQSVTFNPGESLAASLVIDVVDDDLVEFVEFVEFTFGDLPPRVIQSTTGNLTHTFTVRDDDKYVVDFSIASQTVEEDAGTAFVEVSVDPVPSTNLTIPIVVNSGGTLAADDYVPDTAVIIFAGQMTGTFSVVITDDTLGELEEYVDFLFGDADGNLPDNVVRGTQTTYQLRVTSNDGPPPPPDYMVSFSAGTLTVAEDVGTVEVEVFLSDGTLPLTDDITILITVVDGGTLTGADCTYEKKVIFPAGLVPTTPGQLMGSFMVTIHDDKTAEKEEYIEFAFDTLPSVVGPGSPVTRRLVVTDNDDFKDDEDVSRISFLFDGSVVTEDDATALGSGVAVVVSIDPELSDDITIPITVVVGGTLTGADYTYDGNVTIIAGQIDAIFRVIILDDDLVEGDEYVEFTFGDLPENVEAFGQTTYTLTVEDDETYVVSFVDPSSGFMESDSEGLVFVSIFPEVPATVSPITIPITVVVVGTLTGADCTYEKEVIFNPGDSEGSFAVTIVDDDLVEGDESVTFGFDLGLLSGATVVPSTTESTTHTLTVEDNDNYEVSFVVDGSTVDEGIGTVNVEVRLSGIPFPISAGIGDIEIPIIVSASTLTLGADCTYEEFVTFPTSQDPSVEGAAELISSFVVTIVNDNEVEDDEYANFTFGELPPRVIRSITDRFPVIDTHTLTVEDNDYEVSFREASLIVAENVGIVNVEVVISPLPIEPLSIPITVVDRTLSDADCTYDDVVVFDAGQERSSFVVTIVDDAEPEGGEFVDFTFDTSLLPDVLAGSEPTCRLVVIDNDGPYSADFYKVSFSTSDSTADEDADIVNVEMTISPAPNAVLEIPINVDEIGRTLSDDDCTYDKFVYFSPALSSSSFAVTIVNDIEVEDDEYVDFTFDTSALSEVMEGTPGTHRLTVTDDDNYAVSFSKTSGIVDEDVGTVKVEVSIFPMPSESLSIPIIIVDRTLSDADCTYEDVVVFDAGQERSSFVVTIVDDAEPEGGEYVDFTFDTSALPDVLAGSEPTCRLVVIDNDGPYSADFYKVSFSASDRLLMRM